ncbi:uncharacterized protein LOC132708127 isoform X2 [Cylas formicarius]|uniref:uncharacterized protein LOC132708127 isoform X2 n=1 Tax=Cylas formicarius TaxID=197179 RepID=UPI00295891FD|nr:uncharacterized protein LOC132708127 isoform X2 [Cylas formicarius]
MVLNTEWAQVEIIDLINDGSGLAFGIIGGRSTGVVVKTILPGGVADRDGRLQSGDHILQIGDVNLRGLGSEQVASVLRQCGVHVRMVVARPVESTSPDFQALGSHAPVVSTKILGDPVELDRHLVENGYAEALGPPPVTFNPYVYAGQPTELHLHSISGIVDVVKNPLPIGRLPDVPPTIPENCPKAQPANSELPETETFTVVLMKDDLGLGITVAGYVCEREEISGIFVKSVSEGSAADLTKTIKINDRIVEVNGLSVIGYTNHEAVELLRNTGPMVNIKFERYLRGPKYERLQQAIKANELRPPSPSSPTASSLPKVPLSLVHMSHLGIEPEGESRTSIDFDSAVLLDNDEEEIVIGGRKSLDFSISSRESIYEKWRCKFPEDVRIVIAQMHKGENNGLGISLEGTVDVEDGTEVRPHHYIRNILPDGPVGICGVLQSGDELVEVNGIQLLGLNHLQVVSILRQLPSFVSLVCARYPIPMRVIDTSQHPQAFQARKILAGSLQNLIQPADQNFLVKAKSEISIVSSVGSEACTTNRSRSLEIIAGLPMWCEEPITIELNKGEHGLGFSILDYQDPLDSDKTVIVIRSLIPGGVAQTDGRLIPGDRLLGVNDFNLEHAGLDVAVQVLKGAPKGIVKILVAKPINGGETISHASQDTEEDNTCLDDFQECIEEFQECLDAVHICIDDDYSFNHSSCTSRAEDLGQKNDFVDSARLNTKDRDSNACDSDQDASFKSTNDVSDRAKPNDDETILTNSVNKLTKSKNLTSSDWDGYETCPNEEHFGIRDSPRITEVQINVVDRGRSRPDDLTPTNSRLNLTSQIHKDLSKPRAKDVISEPCLHEKYVRYTGRVCLASTLEDDFKLYDNRDEFFLIQYPSDDGTTADEVCKSLSVPNVLETYEIPVTGKLTYKLREYYNDYENCLDSCAGCDEMSDSQIFNEIFLPFKSKSAPDVTYGSFVTLTYDPGPGHARRKSAFVAGYPYDESEMTVIRQIEPDYGTMKDHEPDSQLNRHFGPTHTVKVFREPGRSLGISIVGGKVDIEHSDNSTDPLLGIFVKNVLPNSPAGKTGQFQVGDRILEVGGINLRHASHEKAVEAIKNAPDPVEFFVQSLIPWDKSQSRLINDRGIIETPRPPDLPSNEIVENHDETNVRIMENVVPGSKTLQDSTGLAQSPLPNQHSPEYIKKTVTIKEPDEEVDGKESPETLTQKDATAEESASSDDDYDDDIGNTELEGRTLSAKGQQIDRASAGNVKRTKEEICEDLEDEDDFGYTMHKVKKKYSNLGHTILIVQLERGTHGGLGLSLAGHKDRNCMAVFVCGLNPNGAAFKTGSIQIGDEILEVNGVVLHGRCHLNASAIIKSLSGPVFKVIILRRKTAIDDIAVKPITQFPISLAEETSEEHFSASYPNVRTVAVKKANQSLGIMIIEGKHAKVGQGIFISDIQEGSSAEKAGLEIGEMILAVNKDSLVGASYDTAATLLRRTEGLVTLVVSNPSAKDTSRSVTPVPTTPTPALQTNDVVDLRNHHTPRSALKVTAPSRSPTPIPEPPPDPLTASIVPGKETSIEINTENKTLGVVFVGGKDTAVTEGIILTDIYPGGAAHKDGRLQPGDQVLDVNGTSLKDVTNIIASQSLRQTLPKMKLLVYRPMKVQFIPVEIDLVKKPGKGLGISVMALKSKKGVFISDIIAGGAAEADGRISIGDLLTSVNGQTVEGASTEEAGAILKTAVGKVSIKLNRYKVSISK